MFKLAPRTVRGGWVGPQGRSSGVLLDLEDQNLTPAVNRQPGFRREPSLSLPTIGKVLQTQQRLSKDLSGCVQTEMLLICVFLKTCTFL